MNGASCGEGSRGKTATALGSGLSFKDPSDYVLSSCLFLFKDLLFLCMYMCVWVPLEPEESFGTYGAGVADGFGPSTLGARR